MSVISIVMHCYNRAYDLVNVLNAYDQQTVEEPFELIAVDDASNDATYEVLTTYRPARFTLQVERLGENQGPAAARNRGISLANSPLILFVGDDIVPDRRLIEGHLAAHRRYPGMSIAILGWAKWPDDLYVNTLMTHIDGVGAEQFSYFYLKDGQEYDFRHLYTANISLKAGFLKSLDQWFDTGFPYAAFEDVELSYRLSKKGLRIIYSSALVGYHYHYHTIWSFSKRQYRSGLMGCILVRKHPDLGPIIKGEYWPLRKMLWKIKAYSRIQSPDCVDRLEAQVLHLASAYETTPHKLLDTLYVKTLNYFFRKGLIDGTFGETELSRRVRSELAQKDLAPLLAWFIQESERFKEPLPKGYGPWMLDGLYKFGGERQSSKRYSTFS